MKLYYINNIFSGFKSLCIKFFFWRKYIQKNKTKKYQKGTFFLEKFTKKINKKIEKKNLEQKSKKTSNNKNKKKMTMEN